MNPMTMMAIIQAVAAAPELMKSFSGGSGFGTMPTMTSGQKSLLDNITKSLGMKGGLGQGYGQGIDYLKQLMDPNSQAVSQFAEPYMNQFEQETIPMLAERYAGGGALSSSGFAQALGGAGANLQSTLAALKAGLGQQAAGQLMGQYGNLAGLSLGATPFGYVQPQQGFGSGLLNSFAQGFGQQYGSQLGKPAMPPAGVGGQ